MAYGFGTTVNPQLGAVDYSNYLRGALTGAQMQAQGGAAMAAGVQNALAGIGEGIQKYQQNKILQSEIMGGVEENIDFLVNNNPESIQNAPKAVQDVLRRMEDGKGVSLKDSAYLKSWSDSATKQAKDNIENNALVSALGPNPDGTEPTGQQMITRYFGAGGQNKSLIGDLLAFGNNPLEVEALETRTKGQDLSNARAEQELEGTVPLTAYQQAQLQSQAVQDALNRAQIGQIENENRFRQETEGINKTVRDIIAANTNTEGELQTDTLLPDLISAGAPVDFALNIVSNIVKASPDNAFRANAYTVENPDTGEKYTVVNTSSGSAQIMRPPGEETTTAFQQDISEKQRQFANARKSYESGNVISAIQILRSLGVKSNITGNLIGPDDLEEFYGVDTSSQNLNDAGSVNYRDVAEVLNANAG